MVTPALVTLATPALVTTVTPPRYHGYPGPHYPGYPALVTTVTPPLPWLPGPSIPWLQAHGHDPWLHVLAVLQAGRAGATLHREPGVASLPVVARSALGGAPHLPPQRREAHEDREVGQL